MSPESEAAVALRRLLREAAEPLPGIRPALVEGAALGDWDELRRFRHFFRNAYAAVLEWAPLREHAARVERVHALARRDFARIEALLRASLARVVDQAAEGGA